MVCGLCVLLSGIGSAQNAYFAVEGKIMGLGGKAPAIKTIACAKKVGECFGNTSRGNIVVGLGKKVIEAGYDIKKGYTLAIVSPKGTILNVIAEDVLRAYPAPRGDAIAFINIHHSPYLYGGGKVSALSIKQKVSQFAWLPDAVGFLYTGHLSDWSPIKINNPKNTEEFLRLADSNIYLYKLADDSIKQLTKHPREDWNPVASPDCKTVLFQSSRINYSCFWKIGIDGTGLAQVTFPKPKLGYEGNVPIAYTDQLLWNAQTNTLIYGTSTPKNIPEIREMRPDGSGAKKLAIGRKPILINGGAAVAFITDKGSIQSLKLK